MKGYNDEREKKAYMDEQASLFATRFNANIFEGPSTSEPRNNDNKNPFGNHRDDGGNSPPITPQSCNGVFVSPPKSSQHRHGSHKSHHESDTKIEITDEDLMKFQQDDFF